MSLLSVEMKQVPHTSQKPWRFQWQLLPDFFFQTRIKFLQKRFLLVKKEILHLAWNLKWPTLCNGMSAERFNTFIDWPSKSQLGPSTIWKPLLLLRHGFCRSELTGNPLEINVWSSWKVIFYVPGRSTPQSRPVLVLAYKHSTSGRTMTVLHLVNCRCRNHIQGELLLCRST